MKKANRLDTYLTKKPKENGIYYILQGHEPVPEPDYLKWIKWLDTADTIVSEDIIKFGEDTITVTTAFIGMNYPFTPYAPPLLFESQISGRGELEEEARQYSTWDEALEGHSIVAEKIKRHLMGDAKKGFKKES